VLPGDSATALAAAWANRLQEATTKLENWYSSLSVEGTASTNGAASSSFPRVSELATVLIPASRDDGARGFSCSAALARDHLTWYLSSLTSASDSVSAL